MDPRKPSRKVVLLAVFLSALAVRCIHVSAIGGTPFARLLIGDGRAYDRWAQAIAAGDWIGKETFYQAPLYPYALATLYAVAGRDPMTVRFAQAVLGALASVLLAFAGVRWLGEREGAVAGVLLALYPPAIFFDGIVQKTSLDNVLTCALLAILGAYVVSRRTMLLPAAGAVTGLLALTRENALVFLGILALWLPFHLSEELPRRRVAAVALLFAGVATVLAPVGLRNRIVGGDFLITTSQAGPNFFIGNHDGASGRYLPIRPGREVPEFERTDATEVAEQAAGRALTASEVSRYWWSRSFEWIRGHPVAWCALLGKKLLLVWNRVEIPDTDSFDVYRESSPLLNALGFVLGFGVLLTLAAAGMVLAWRWPRRPTLLYLMLFGFSSSVALFYVFARYRFPMVPILVLFAATALVAGFDAVRAGVRRPAAVTAVALAAGALLACLPVVPGKGSRRFGYVNLGIGFIDEHDPANAVTFLRKATTLAPMDAESHYNLAIALRELGSTDEAATELGTALRLDPRHAPAHDSLGALLVKRRDLAAAEAHFREAYRIDPSRPTTLVNLGSAALGQGRLAEAADWYRRALVLMPDKPEPHYELAVALTGLRRTDEAKAELEATLLVDPGYAAAHDDLGVLLANRGDLDGAEAHFRAAYRVDPRRTSSLVNLGSVALARGRPAEAVDWYRKAIALDGSLVFARLNLVQALARLGRRDEALAEARAAARLDPANADAAALVARLAGEQKLNRR